ncbi:MAG: hypothetical protein GX774_02000 [Armatimonadetes bacterium]|nr:hypothetical protein [Armatimonadota bacterium]
MKRWGVCLGIACAIGALLFTAARLAGQSEEEQPSYLSAEACAGCHEDLAKEWETHPHARFLMAAGREVEGKGCEECHGPGSNHAAGDIKAIRNPAKMKPAEEAALCLRCHRRDFPAQDWHAAAHGRARIACSKCHDVHHPPKGSKMLRQPVPDLCFSCHPQQRGQFRQNAHHPVLEGRLSCLDCHDPHRPPTRSLLADDTCTQCHAEKAGPFTYAHDVALGDTTEGCLACHRSHGSPHPQLLRLAGRGLCQQCHLDKITHNPGGRCWQSGCHVDFHGSHRDPRFLR